MAQKDEMKQLQEQLDEALKTIATMKKEYRLINERYQILLQAYEGLLKTL